MASSDSDTDGRKPRSSALERSVVGALLSVFALAGLAWAIQLPSGNLLGGTVGLVVALGACALLVRLFLEGVDEA